MKWGVRKKRVSTGSGGPVTSEKAAPKKASASDNAGKLQRTKAGRIEAAPRPKTSRHELTDEELRQIINRINLERQYSQLTASPPSHKDQARQLVVEVLKDVGKQQLKLVVGAAATKGTTAALKKAGVPVPEGKKKK